MATFYEPGRTYTQAEFNELLRQLAAREDLARRDFSTLQSTYRLDPGGEGAFGSPDVFSDAAGVNYWVDYGLPSHDDNGMLTREQVALRAQAEGVPAKAYSTRLTDVRRDGTFKIEGLGGDYGLAAVYNPDGTIREIRPYSHGDDSWWTAIRPAVIMAGLAAGGGWLANALGAGAAGAAGGAAAMTPAEALAAGVAPGAVGGGSMTGVVGGTAAAAGGAAGLGTAAGTAAGATTLGSLLSNPAVVGGGLSLVGGAMGADAARDAARAQEASANAAIEEIRRQYDQNRADQMPWLEAGRTSLADLMARMGDLTTPYTQADFQNDPGYQFELAEGQRALDAAARARGLYGSSGALRELLRYSQGLASTRYQDAWNRDLTQRQNTYNQLAGIAGTGQTAAANLGAMGTNRANTVGDLLTQTGNAQAAGRVGAANAWTQAGSNALNAWQQQMLIDRIGSNLYR